MEQVSKLNDDAFKKAVAPSTDEGVTETPPNMKNKKKSVDFTVNEDSKEKVKEV